MGGVRIGPGLGLRETWLQMSQPSAGLGMGDSTQLAPGCAKGVASEAFSPRLNPGGEGPRTGSITGCSKLRSIALSSLGALEWRCELNYQSGMSGSFCSRQICHGLMLVVRGLDQD